MVRVGKRAHRGIRAGLVALALALAVGAAAQAQSLRAFVPSRPFVPGEQLEIRLSLRGLPSTDVSVNEPDYPAILEVSEGASIETRLVDGDSGERFEATVEISFRAVAPGRAVIPPISVQSGSTVLRSEEYLVEVAERNEPTRVPFNVSWTAEERDIYQGQTVAVSLEMRLVPSFVYPSKIEISPPASGLFAEVQGIGSASSRSFGSQTYHSYPVATFLFTPSRTGAVTIPPAAVQALGFRREAPPLELAVAPVPEAIAESGAIGDFTFEARLSPQRLAVGERLTLEISVRGTGNLSFLDFPAPDTGGLVVTATEERERFEPSAAGYTGERTRRLELSPTEAGDFTIAVPAFTWLNPDTGEIRRRSPQRFDVAVGSALEGSGDAPRAELQLLEVDEVRALEPLDLFRNGAAYGVFLPAFFAVVVVALYRKFGKPKAVTLSLVTLLLGAGVAPELPETELRRGVEAYRAGDAAAAVRHFEQALDERAGSPGIRYNLGIAEFAAGNEGAAVFYLRTALQAKPRFVQALAALESVERELGLSRQLEQQRLVHPDVFFFISAGLFYLLCLLLIFPERRRRGFYFVFVIMLALLFAASVTAIPVTAQRQSEPVAVLAADDAVLRRIPEAGAATWMNLPEGTAVRLEAEHEQYCLISTAYGVQGWVPKEKLRIGGVRGEQEERESL